MKINLYKIIYLDTYIKFIYLLFSIILSQEKFISFLPLEYNLKGPIASLKKLR